MASACRDETRLQRCLWYVAAMRGLYAVIDVGTLVARHLDPINFARELLKNPLAAIQLRAKNIGPAEFLRLLRTLQELAAQADVPLYANDRPDLAALSKCHGVHVGQGDVPILGVREVAPQLAVGFSTHNAAQVEKALKLKPDYLAFGPVFPTQTKRDAEPCVGLSQLENVGNLCRQAKIPLVAIGGIDAGTLNQVAPLAPCVALISAFVPLPGDGTTVGGRHEKLLRLQQLAIHG